ncbi:anti-sigma-K factor RskA [Pseudoduganella flava]|nr:anti-sigma-K factor RskA [Pseudoduganella flava]
MRRTDPQLRDQLAAAYVLGTLHGHARRRFEGWLHGDAALRACVSQWRARLLPLAEFAPARMPRERVWRGIESRLRLQAPGRRWQFWRRDPLQWWKMLAVTAAGAAAVLALVLALALQARTPPADTFAALADERGRPALLVTADRGNHQATVRSLHQIPVPDELTLQLWAITQQGTPRSLALLDERGTATFALNERAFGSDVALLAVSLEPKGGSPNPAAPAGPVLYRGGWVRPF